MTWGHEKNKQWKNARTYMQDICVCGHDEDEHNLGFFTSKRPCKVGGCACAHYKYERRERRFKTG